MFSNFIIPIVTKLVNQKEEYLIRLSNITMYIGYIFTIIYLLGLMVLFIGLIKELYYQTSIIIIPIIDIIIHVVCTFLQSSTTVDKWALYYYISIFLINIVYISILMCLKRSDQLIFDEIDYIE